MYIIYFDHNWKIFMLKIFQYLGPKYVPSRQNVSILSICIILQKKPTHTHTKSKTKTKKESLPIST